MFVAFAIVLVQKCVMSKYYLLLMITLIRVVCIISEQFRWNSFCRQVHNTGAKLWRDTVRRPNSGICYIEYSSDAENKHYTGSDFIWTFDLKVIGGLYTYLPKIKLLISSRLVPLPYRVCGQLSFLQREYQGPLSLGAKWSGPLTSIWCRN